jgi:hypothetical protein
LKTFLSVISAFVLIGSAVWFRRPHVFRGNAPGGCEKIRGTIVCQTSENVGNAPEHSNSQQTTTTSIKKGSLQSSHEEQETCTGPQGQCKYRARLRKLSQSDSCLLGNRIASRGRDCGKVTPNSPGSIKGSFWNTRL